MVEWHKEINYNWYTKKMNRIVLIGNGFDLAHGLKTKYEDSINWYWEQRVMGFNDNSKAISKDCLCEFRIEAPKYKMLLSISCNRTIC